MTSILPATPSTPTHVSPIRPSLLRFGLLALLFAVQVVTILGVLASERTHTEKIMRASASSLMQQLVSRASDSTQRYLAPAARAAEFTRTQLQNGQLALGNDTVLTHDFLDVICSTPELQNIFLARNDGSFLLVGRTVTAGRFRTKLIQIRQGRRLVHLGETDCQGTVLSDRTDPQDVYDPRSRPWYSAAAASTDLIWTDPYVFFTQKIPGVTSAVSVHGEGGELLGIVGTDVALSDLTSFLTSVPVSAHGAAVIGTTSGLAIASPGIDAVFRRNPATLPALSQLSRPAHLTFQNYLLHRQTTMQSLDVEGVPYYALMQPLNIGHGTNWLIGVHAPASDFNGELKSQYLRMQLTALGIGVLSFLLALPLLSRLQAPIQRLALFGLHFQHSFHFNALLSPEGTLLEVNDAALQAAGTRVGEVVNRPFWALPWWQPSTVLGSGSIDQQRLEQAVRLAGRGETMRFEIGVGRADRPPLDVDLSLKPVRDRAGRVQYIMAEGRDITDQQHLERGLREREERLQTVLNALDEGVLVQDLDGRVLSMNARAEQILSLRSAEVYGMILTDLDWQAISSDGQPFAASELPRRAAVQTGLPQPNLVFGVVREGVPTLWLSMNCSPLIRPDETIPYAVVSSFSDITRRRESELSLAHQAQHDPLTGLPNRTLFQDRLAQALESGRPGVVAFLDLDHFKAINDTLGHDIGDQLLQAVAERVTALLRPSDTVARMGGDEFTIILTEVATPEMAGELARKILNVLDQPFLLSGHELRVSASLGLALFPLDGFQVEGLLKNADTAMYHAKTSGKNAFRIYKPQMANHHYVKARQYQHTDLQRALAQREFVLHFQPLYSLVTGEISGLEALLRWQHPERGLLGPDHFLPALETSGLIHPAGSWILQEACREAARIQAQSGRALHVAVNVSPLQFEREDFVQEVQQALQDAGLEAGHLELEMTEGLVMNDPDAVILRMQQLRALGVRLAIDDFGTGYSNLSVLRRLPIHILKIDRSLMAEVGHDVTVVQTIISLARNLSMELVAEGVETADQLQLLLLLGCDRMQGYYASQALPPAELALLLHAPPLLLKPPTAHSLLS